MAVWTVHDSTSHAEQIRKKCSLIICCSDADECAMAVVPSSDDIVIIRSPAGSDEYIIIATEQTDQPFERKCVLNQNWKSIEGGD
ncbi:hypothetical protein [Candidatus Methanomassiliicoccus intestinalis]|uniref:hypothetical protein n=1 Tax=Candidatus Methanomassiliicoccus intestinalis TaxID=1406512 RepID=UPI0037DC5BB2